MYNNFVHCFLLVYKERLNVSYRRFVEIAEENNLQRMLCIKRIPHFTTLQKFMKKLDKKLLERMVRACRKLLKLKNIDASIDGTGFSNTNPSHYYTKTINGKSVKNYTKTVFLADNKSKIILNVRTHSKNIHETNDFIPMVSELKRILRSILADKGYDSMRNRKFCINNNIEVHIPFREYSRTRKQEFCRKSKRKSMEERFDRGKYRYRVIIESVNSAIKRTLGGYVNSKLGEMQEKQVIVKVLAYNLERISRKIKIILVILWRGFLQSPA